jgi:hypothetical protein
MESQKLRKKLPFIETSQDEYIDNFLNKTYLRRTVNSFQGGGGENSSVLLSNPSVQKFVLESKIHGVYVEDIHTKSIAGISFETFCASDSNASKYAKAWGIPGIDCAQLVKEKGWIGAGQFSSGNSQFIIKGETRNRLEIELRDFDGESLDATKYPIHVRFASSKAIFSGCPQPKSNGIIAVSPTMTKEVCLKFGLQGKYRAAVRVLRYDEGKYDEDLPCQRVHIPGAGPARYNCDFEDYSINVPLIPHENDSYYLRCQDLQSEKESIPCDFVGVWLRNFDSNMNIVFNYPFRWFGVEAIKISSQKAMLSDQVTMLKKLKAVLGGKIIIFNGSSLVRELYRGFNEILQGSAIPCFFRFGSGAPQKCVIPTNGDSIKTFYVGRPRPWADNFKDEVSKCMKKSSSADFCGAFKFIRKADVFITSPEGLSGSQSSRAEQANMMKKTSEGLEGAFGSPSTRKVKFFFLETTIAGEGGIATVFQNSARIYAFNKLVWKLAFRENAEVVRLFEASRIILGSSFDNVHMCPQCCNDGRRSIRTESQWIDKERSLAEMMGCHMKVDILIVSLLKSYGAYSGHS